MAGAIEVTDEMVYAYAGEPEITATDAHAIRVGLDAVLAIVERDNTVIRKPTAEDIASWPRPRRRLRACVERWPGAEIDGDYDPRCCRFPKSCSASVPEDAGVADEYLEPPR